MRFLNQKLGKRTSRKTGLLKSRLAAERVTKSSRPKAPRPKLKRAG